MYVAGSSIVVVVIVVTVVVLVVLLVVIVIVVVVVVVEKNYVGARLSLSTVTERGVGHAVARARVTSVRARQT